MSEGRGVDRNGNSIFARRDRNLLIDGRVVNSLDQLSGKVVDLDEKLSLQDLVGGFNSANDPTIDPFICKLCKKVLH